MVIFPKMAIFLFVESGWYSQSDGGGPTRGLICHSCAPAPGSGASLVPLGGEGRGRPDASSR